MSTAGASTAGVIDTEPLERNAIRTAGLTKHYGKIVALSHLDLAVPVGAVFGYLGPNGAGKTTTIRLLMGLLRPTAGSASVLGLDATNDREIVDRRVGYLPGDFAAYPDLTGAQYLRFLSNLRGNADWKNVTGLADRLDLDLSRHIGELSHGNRQKVGLVQAFMHDPDLLVLDEPTTGLDPLIQREFLAMVREASGSGKTVFLSSHILAEVEAVADWVGILRAGRLVVVETVKSLKQKAMRRLDLRFSNRPPTEALARVDGVRKIDFTGSVAHVVIEGSTAELFRAVAPFGVENVRTYEADLEEIFLSYYEDD